MSATTNSNPVLMLATSPGRGLRRHHDPQYFTPHAAGPDRRRLWPFVLDWPWYEALELVCSDAAGPACRRISRWPS